MSPMNVDELMELFVAERLYCGRILSGSKRGPDGHKCVWNANVVSKSHGKVWFGDLNLTKEGKTLKEIATKFGEPLYVLREMDCRFERQDDPIETLISKAVWNTELDIP
jgi:hypothetical protein